MRSRCVMFSALIDVSRITGSPFLEAESHKPKVWLRWRERKVLLRELIKWSADDVWENFAKMWQRNFVLWSNWGCSMYRKSLMFWVRWGQFMNQITSFEFTHQVSFGKFQDFPTSKLLFVTSTSPPPTFRVTSSQSLRVLRTDAECY